MSTKNLKKYKGLSQKIKKKGSVYHGFRRAFIRNSKLLVGARWLLINLMTYKRGDPSCFPGLGRLANDAGVSYMTIKKWRDELVKAGYLKKIYRGQGKSIRYVPSYIPEFKGNRKKDGVIQKNKA